MKKLLFGLSVVGLLVGIAFAGAYLYEKATSPVGKCFQLIDSKGDAFIASVVVKVESYDEVKKLFRLKLVGHKEPESLEEVMGLMFLQQSSLAVPDDKMDSLKEVACPAVIAAPAPEAE